MAKRNINPVAEELAARATKDKTISVRITQEQYDQLLELAKASGQKVTYNQYVYTIIAIHLRERKPLKKSG
jgi:predicted DNA-binding protein